MQTPSGFEMELGWNPIVVDERAWSTTTYRGISLWGHRPENLTLRARLAARDARSRRCCIRNSSSRETKHERSASGRCVRRRDRGAGADRLAHLLGAGHRVVVLEREPVFYGNARAVYTDDECMRIFQHLAVADELQARMMMETPVQLVRPDGTPITQYMPRKRPLGWPIINFFYQPYLETTLSDTLSRYPNVTTARRSRTSSASPRTRTQCATCAYFNFVVDPKLPVGGAQPTKFRTASNSC